MVVHNHLKLQFQEIQYFIQAPTGTGQTYGVQTQLWENQSHPENNREKSASKLSCYFFPILLSKWLSKDR